MSSGLRWTEDMLAAHQERMRQFKKSTPSPAQPAAPAPKARLRALGRMKAGRMNQTEQRYADEVLEPARQAGTILWWRFEGMTFKLADDCRITPDFDVMTADGLLEVHDVKGSAAVFEDDAKVKMRVLADMFPVRVIAVWPIPKKQGGGWQTHEF